MDPKEDLRVRILARLMQQVFEQETAESGVLYDEFETEKEFADSCYSALDILFENIKDESN